MKSSTSGAYPVHLNFCFHQKNMKEWRWPLRPSLCDFFCFVFCFYLFYSTVLLVFKTESFITYVVMCGKVLALTAKRSVYSEYDGHLSTRWRVCSFSFSVLRWYSASGLGCMSWRTSVWFSTWLEANHVCVSVGKSQHTKFNLTSSCVLFVQLMANVIINTHISTTCLHLTETCKMCVIRLCRQTALIKHTSCMSPFKIWRGYFGPP